MQGKIKKYLWAIHDMMALELADMQKQKKRWTEEQRKQFFGRQRFPRPLSERMNVLNAMTELQHEIDDLQPSSLPWKPQGLLKRMMEEKADDLS